MAIVSVVKYDGDPDVFAWKYPDDELGTWTQLIVNESQQAILFQGGQALDVFEAGHHTLNTKNIPFLENLINLPFGGDSPFKAEVWFVNKVFNLDVKWGTPTPVQLMDQIYRIFVPVRSNGVFGIRIDNPKKFLVKLVGTLPAFSRQEIARYFRGLYITRVKDAISTYIIERKISILEISMFLDELSDYLKERTSPIMDEYGIELVNFFVNEVSVPDDDPAVIKLRDSFARKAEMDIIGFDYVQERSFDTLEGAATNPGSMAAPMMGAGMGMGMGFGMGAGMGGAFSELAQNLNTSKPAQRSAGSCLECSASVSVEHKFCPSCGTRIQSLKPSMFTRSRFCPNCGTSIPQSGNFCPGCGVSIDQSGSNGPAGQVQRDE